MKKIVFFLIALLFLLSGCNNISNSQLFSLQSKIDIEDLRFPATSIKTTGSSNIPDFVVLKNNTYTLAFSPTTMEQAFFTMQTPHNRIDNSTLMPHFHWTSKTAGVGNVVWCMEYTCANIDSILPNTIQKCVIDTADGVFKHQMTDMINITNTLTDSSMCAIRVFRNATAPADTFTQDALLLEFDIHYYTSRE